MALASNLQHSRGVYRSDRHKITLAIDGIANSATNKDSNGIICDSVSGLSITQTSSYYYPGNMADPIPVGGLPTPTEATITVAWRYDTYRVYHAIYHAVRSNTVGCSITIMPLTTSHGPVTTTAVKWSGILTGVTPPDLAAATSDVVYMTLTMLPFAELDQGPDASNVYNDSNPN